LNKGFNLNPSNIDYYLQLAYCNYNINNFDKALELGNKVLEYNSKEYKAFYILGLIYKKMQLIDKAIECFQAAIKIHPEYKDALNELNKLTNF